MKIRRKLLFVAALAAVSISAKAATNQYACGNLGDTSNYIINDQPDPDLTLVRGFTYTFNISVASIHPFYIKTAHVTGSGSQYNTGVSAQGVTSGSITFAVPTDAPDTLHYQCGNHLNMHGLLHMTNAPNVGITQFNVSTNVVIHSTGTDALNVNVLTSSDLTSNVWTDAQIQANTYSNGTNSTQVVKPTGNTAFFQVEQGFFNP